MQPIFDRECVKCHGAKEKKAKLDLSAPESYKALVNMPSGEVPATLRVKAGNPEQSYLWLKLDHRSEEGSGMPKGLFSSRRLAQKDLDIVRSWIAAGLSLNWADPASNFYKRRLPQSLGARWTFWLGHRTGCIFPRDQAMSN